MDPCCRHLYDYSPAVLGWGVCLFLVQIASHEKNCPNFWNCSARVAHMGLIHRGKKNGCDQLQGDWQVAWLPSRSLHQKIPKFIECHCVLFSAGMASWFHSVAVRKCPYKSNFGEKRFILSHSSKFQSVVGGSWNCHNTSRRLGQRDVNVCLPFAQLTLSTLICSRMWAQGMVLLNFTIWRQIPTEIPTCQPDL